MTRNRNSPSSVAAQANRYIDPATGAVSPPVHAAVTYARNAEYDSTAGFTYTRGDNPTYKPAERLISELEGGCEALLFASGLAAAHAIMETIETGAHVVAPSIMYHGSLAWLRRISERRGIALTLFDAADPEGIQNAVRPGETVLVWTENPINPTWDVIDLRAAADLAHRAGAVLCVDSTTATPVHTRPIEFGADFVFHSATKYLNGHSDVLAGVIVAKEPSPRWEEIQNIRKISGGVAGPFEAWLLQRGMRTLFVRVERASSNALKIARHFEGHPKVEAVLYPGLESHPGHETAKRQMENGFGAMMSMIIKGGAEETIKVALSTELFIPATSLGGVESLIEHRLTSSGPDSGIAPNLLRLSIGIEDADDLIADLEHALAAI